MEKTILDIPGIEMGHATNTQEKTGCTILIFREGAIAGVDIRGSAPGTRETELLRPTYMLRKIYGIMLTGGSAFGLRTADGAMQYFAENGIGYDARGNIIPIIPAAVIFDFYGRKNTALPSTQMGYEACQNAEKTFQEGLVGVGTGALVGKILGLANGMNGGFAGAAIELPGGVIIAAVVVVNALGDVINPVNGKIVAGACDPEAGKFADTFHRMIHHAFDVPGEGTNTTLAVVATNAAFNKEEMNKIAKMGQSGITRATRPAHTMHDGDAVFALSIGDTELKADINVVGAAAAHVISQAIVRAVEITNS